MLKGKNALITGASRGIGRQIALTFAQNGSNIAIVYAGNKEAAESVCLEASKYGVTAKCFPCDVADFDKTKDLVTAVIDEFGSIDILVNNAGIVKDALILSMKKEDFATVIETNLYGTFNMIKHTYSHFMKKRNGKIINITSVIGLMGNAGQANYAAAKAGIIGLTKSVAKELSNRGVCCNAIAPGFIKTDMTDALSDNIKEQIKNSIPMKRIGSTEDIACLALFLASDKADYITGEVIRVDGGLCI